MRTHRGRRHRRPAGHLDRRLETLGRPRRASVTVPYHAAAAAAVPGTSLMATLPSSFAIQHAAPGVTSVIPAPDEIGAISYAMSWHPRLDDDDAQRWLRDTVITTLSIRQTATAAARRRADDGKPRMQVDVETSDRLRRG